MKSIFVKTALVCLVVSCGMPQNLTVNTTVQTALTTSTATLAPVSIQNIPSYAIKPATGKVSITGQLKIPAHLILSPADMNTVTAPPQGITAPPQGITAPPQGITAPPQGITAPPLGILPAQSIFGIRSLKSVGLATAFWAEFFRDNFRLNMTEVGQQAFINSTVLQYINGTPYFVASYVIPNLLPNQTYTLEARHPMLNLSSTLHTGNAGQTVALDLDLGSTAVERIKQAAQARNKKVSLAYLSQNLNELETISHALQQRYRNEITEAQLQAVINNYVDQIPAYSDPVSIRVAHSSRYLQIKQGQTLQLAATTFYANRQTTQAVQWRTQAGDIVSVQADGTVLGIKPGVTILEAIAIDNPTLKDQIQIEVY